MEKLFSNSVMQKHNAVTSTEIEVLSERVVGEFSNGTTALRGSWS